MADNSVLRVGVGAGFSDDRIDPALELVTNVPLDYLVFECLAERTIARETLSRLKDANLGYAPSLEARMLSVLPDCVRRGTRIVTNMGAANPAAAARIIRDIGRSSGLRPIKTATIVGDDVADIVRQHPGLALLEGGTLDSILPRMVSANAYLGADVVRDGLALGADVVVGGRVADPSLFLGCLLHGHGWAADDWSRVATGILAGHLLECSAQLTGGCFADPGFKDVPDMARLGFPYAEVTKSGELVMRKAPGSGGRLSVATCTEQLLYEIHDPSAYVTPDCVLDVSQVHFESRAADVVECSGARATMRTDTLKVAVGYHDGWIGEGEVGYAGPNALVRAQLAQKIVLERLQLRGLKYEEIRVDLIGATSLHGAASTIGDPYEIRLRVAGRSQDRKTAEALGFEVRAMHVNGPAGGGGGRSSVREVLAVKSLLLPRDLVRTTIEMEEGA